ncbi:hypothetical protein VFPFJ_10919 [Purpureocillium lilacinum]|uniref:Uncharacterized protein n=1 Tax=Purpureocillium lilacinum TaxID=33203 RepID=A0A179GCF7_PURLI|nr:hypothetical protein VFPFJ_10919 [Purpureocillium lilacinum]OAQ75081.1 hypothetical protein VFPFJ_10919 [Purpureocillium lilacinum]
MVTGLKIATGFSSSSTREMQSNPKLKIGVDATPAGMFVQGGPKLDVTVAGKGTLGLGRSANKIIFAYRVIRIKMKWDGEAQYKSRPGGKYGMNDSDENSDDDEWGSRKKDLWDLELLDNKDIAKEFPSAVKIDIEENEAEDRPAAMFRAFSYFLDRETLCSSPVSTSYHLNIYMGFIPRKDNQQQDRKPGKDCKVSSTGHDDDVLVLETFPLTFIREAASKLGSSFYSALTDINAYRMEKFDTLTGFGDYQVGSMMPFAKNHGWVSSVYVAAPVSQLRRTDHEAVAGWVIQENAGVRIRYAGILASSEDPLKNEEDPINALVTTIGREREEGI